VKIQPQWVVTAGKQTNIVHNLVNKRLGEVGNLNGVKPNEREVKCSEV
jgi:hypothetical protein